MTISLIPYPCGAGAEIKGTAQGPEHLRKSGLHSLLSEKGFTAEWLENLSTHHKERIKEVTSCNLGLKAKVEEALRSNHFPVTIGGDHSMAIGTWTGVADVLHTRRKLGLIWVDAHMDAHTGNTSHSGNYHGMPLSYLLGYGDDELTKITGKKPVIAPNHLCLIGIRSFEPEEEELLTGLGARIFTMEEIRQRGLSAVMLEAVKIAAIGTAGFGLSIDVDGFDPKIAPGTGSKEANGLLREEFLSSLPEALVGYEENLLALEIAEYNPGLDSNNITANLIMDIIVQIVTNITTS